MSGKRFEVDIDHLLVVWDTEKNKRLEIEDIVDLLNFQNTQIKILKDENEQLKEEIRAYPINEQYAEEIMQQNQKLRIERNDLRRENEQLRKENTALDKENAEHLADNIKELDLLEKLTKFLHECDLTDEQRALFHDMITEEDLQPNLEVE